MAIDWASYRLTPDLSGLAGGIANYFQGQTAQKQWEREMGLKEAMAAAQMQQLQQGGGRNQFWADTFEYEDPETGEKRYARFGVDAAGNPIQVDLPPGVSPITSSLAGQLNYSQQLIDDAAEKKRREEEARLNAQKGLLPDVTARVEGAKAEARAAGAANIEEQTQLGKQRATVSSAVRSGYDAANKLEPTLAELESALKLASQGKYAQAGTAVAKYIPGVDVSNEESLNSAILQFSTEKLLTIPGIATDADFQNQVRSFVNQGNSSAANKLILDRVKRQNEYNKYIYKNYNVTKNKMGSKFDPLSWEQPSYYQFLEDKGYAKPTQSQGGQQQQGQQPNVIDFGSLKR